MAARHVADGALCGTRVHVHVHVHVHAHAHAHAQLVFCIHNLFGFTFTNVVNVV